MMGSSTFSISPITFLHEDVGGDRINIRDEGLGLWAARTGLLVQAHSSNFEYPQVVFFNFKDRVQIANFKETCEDLFSFSTLLLY